MEKVLEKIKKLEKEIEIMEKELSYCIPYGQYEYIETKVKEEKIISPLELRNFARRYGVERELDKLYDKLEKLKDEFREKRDEFFDYLEM